MTTVTNTHFNKASQLHRNGKTEEAIKELTAAIEEEPEDTKAYLVLGAIYETRGQNEKAAEIYTSALDVNLDDPQVNLRLGVLLTQMGSYNEALTPLRMAWSNDKTNARTASALAQALDAYGDYATAKIMYEEAIKLDPGLADAYYNLGTLRYNEGKFESAISYFTNYMIKAGDTSKAHRNIGKALMQLGHLEAAITSFNRAARLDPRDATIYYNLALAYNAMDNPRLAFDNYRQALKINPNYTEARYTYAKALLFSGQLPAAIAEFQTVIKQDPDHHRALNGLATCFLKQQDSSQAAPLLRRAIEASPEFAYAHYNLGIALRKMGYEYEAIHHFQEAARLDQTDQLGFRAPDSAHSARIPNTSRLGSASVSRRLSASAHSL